MRSVTAVTFTSIDAYRSIETTGALTRQQRVIVESIERGRDYSLQELVRATFMPVNVISGRCNELRKLGVLELGPQRACSLTRRQINPVRLPVPAATQGALFDA
jgi:hypothetical protein